MGLSILGVALGVTVVIAVDLASSSASRAFERSVQLVAGSATHQLTAGPAGVPDTLYRDLKTRPAMPPMAPVVQGYLTIPGESRRTLMLLGLDLFAERQFRPFLSALPSAAAESFFTNPDAVLMTRRAAASLGLSSGGFLQARSGSHRVTLQLTGYLEPPDAATLETLDHIILCDIATAQEVLLMAGRISWIDLILTRPQEAESGWQKTLPPGVTLQRSLVRSKTANQMIEAFRLNLTAMSLLALIVGMFLIYNTMTFSVLQRRPLLGLLRSQGVTRREIFRLVLREALLLGIVGTLLGLFAGIMLGKGLVRLVIQSINDLYFVLPGGLFSLSPFSLLKGLLLGLAATLAAALRPAIEATRSPVGQVLRRSAAESNLTAALPRLTWQGLAAILIGILILWLPGRMVLFSFIGMVPLVIGFALLTPLAIQGIMKLVMPLLQRLFGLVGRMAARDVVAHMSRTAVAIAALALAVAAAVGVGTMIGTFRETITVWLRGRLDADIYVSAPTMVSRFNDGTLPPGLVERISRLPGIQGINYYRDVRLENDGVAVHLLASQLTPAGEAAFRWKSGQPEKIWPAFNAGEAVIVSEPFAWHRQVAVGDSLSVITDRGRRSFHIAGIYYDYSSDMGLVFINHATYRRLWDDPFISGIGVDVAAADSIAAMIAAIRRLIPENEEVIVQSQRNLRESSMLIFDRTFIITSVLQTLAIVVAFISILASLMALQLERSRTLGVLRAIGMTPPQVWGLTALQTGLMGLVAGLLSLPLGNLLALVLIYVINKRSFGWTLQYAFQYNWLIQAFILAIGASLLAGLYPAWRMTRAPAVGSLRDE